MFASSRSALHPKWVLSRPSLPWSPSFDYKCYTANGFELSYQQKGIDDPLLICCLKICLRRVLRIAACRQLDSSFAVSANAESCKIVTAIAKSSLVWRVHQANRTESLFDFFPLLRLLRHYKTSRRCDRSLCTHDKKLKSNCLCYTGNNERLKETMTMPTVALMWLKLRTFVTSMRQRENKDQKEKRESEHKQIHWRRREENYKLTGSKAKNNIPFGMQQSSD